MYLMYVLFVICNRAYCELEDINAVHSVHYVYLRNIIDTVYTLCAEDMYSMCVYMITIMCSCELLLIEVVNFTETLWCLPVVTITCVVYMYL